MRFSSYIWNMRRLTRSTAREFSKAVKKDYARLKNEGLLDPKKMDEITRYNVNQLSIKHPVLYLNIRPFYESKDKFKHFVSTAMKSVLPKYKQRLHTIDMLNELISTQEDLERNVEKLEEKLKDKSNES